MGPMLHSPKPPVARPPGVWTDIVARAQPAYGEQLDIALRHGRFGLDAYVGWLANESAACRLCALSFDAVAAWQGSQPALQATALAWSEELREVGALAAADVRRLGGIAPASAQSIGDWHGFLARACGSQRVGEALGAALLQVAAVEGPLRSALECLRGRPMAETAHAYLDRRLKTGPDPRQAERDALMDTHAAAALGAGALRAALWRQQALQAVLA